MVKISSVAILVVFSFLFVNTVSSYFYCRDSLLDCRFRAAKGYCHRSWWTKTKCCSSCRNYHGSTARRLPTTCQNMVSFCTWRTLHGQCRQNHIKKLCCQTCRSKGYH